MNDIITEIIYICDIDDLVALNNIDKKFRNLVNNSMYKLSKKYYPKTPYWRPFPTVKDLVLIYYSDYVSLNSIKYIDATECLRLALEKKDIELMEKIFQTISSKNDEIYQLMVQGYIINDNWQMAKKYFDTIQLSEYSRTGGSKCLSKLAKENNYYKEFYYAMLKSGHCNLCKLNLLVGHNYYNSSFISDLVKNSKDDVLVNTIIGGNYNQILTLLIVMLTHDYLTINLISLSLKTALKYNFDHIIELLSLVTCKILSLPEFLLLYFKVIIETGINDLLIQNKQYITLDNYYFLLQYCFEYENLDAVDVLFEILKHNKTIKLPSLTNIHPSFKHEIIKLINLHFSNMLSA
jgi:hypothetical protein